MGRDLVVFVLELNLLEHGERDWVDKVDTSIDTTRVHNKNLLVAFLETEELGLWIVKRTFVVQTDEIFATFIRANWDALLREACILLNVPNLQNPVRV